MEHLERDAEHRGVHKEQTRWPVVEVVLLTGEGHPSRARPAANLPVKAGTEVLHPWLSHGTVETNISLHGRRELREIALGESRHRDGSTQALCNLATVLRAKARGTLRQEAEGDAQERDNIRDRPVRGIAPRRKDHNLRHDDCTGAYHPPQLRPGEEEDRGQEE
jgi:hypothetical protein